MSTMTLVRAVPRTVVGTYLKAARVPLHLAVRVTGQADNDAWPPALAFDRFEVGVHTMVGSLLKDDALLEQARVQRARVAQLRKAVDLRTVAEQERQLADAELHRTQRQAEEQREEVERQAAQREQEVERQAQQRRQAVEQKAATKAAAVRRTQTAQEKAIARQERAAKQQALGKEVEALAKTKDALKAQETTMLVEDAIEGSKAARKSR